MNLWVRTCGLIGHILSQASAVPTKLSRHICIATSNKGSTTSNKKLLVPMPLLQFPKELVSAVVAVVLY